MSDRILEIHKRYKYIVNIQGVVDGEGLHVDFPSNIIYKEQLTSLNIHYLIDRSENEISITVLQNEHIITTIKSSDFSYRWFIYADIIGRAMARGIGGFLYSFKDTDGNTAEDFLDLITPPDSEELLEKEKLLAVLFRDMIAGEIPLEAAMELGLIAEYETLFSLLRFGGTSYV